MSALKCWAGGAMMLLALAQGSHAEMTVSQSNAPSIRLDEELDALFGQERSALGSLGADHVQKLVRLVPPAPAVRDAAAEAVALSTPAATAETPEGALAAPEAAEAAPRVAPPAPPQTEPARPAATGLGQFFAAFGGAPRTAKPVADEAFTEAWLARQPVPDTASDDLQCLATAIYFEARGEGPKGQAAVAEVILNRVESPSFPRTICGVVNQGGSGGCQFSYTCDGRSDLVRERGAWQQASKIAAAMLAGAPRDLTDGATHFHTPKVRPDWARRFTRTAVIGRHIFYRQPLRTASN